MNVGRSFALINNIQINSRKRLEIFHLEMPLGLKPYLADRLEVDLDSFYSFWKSDKKT